MKRAAVPNLPKGELLERLRAQVAADRVRQQHFPVPAPLAGLLPGGGLKPGSAYSLGEAGALLLALLAEPSREGTWCGVVGIPEFGVEAAAGAGVVLDRVALVPAPGEKWLAVTAALAEVLPVLALRPGGRVSAGDASRLAARLRDRGGVLLVDGPWPQALATLTLADAAWSGLGKGHGTLTRRAVTVTVATRHAPAQHARLTLPTSDGGLAAVGAPAAVPASLLQVAG
ncbi:MAG TPA: hypothetical protein PLE12_00475 [Propionicimonas sp.]|nr:hypothetical protein [Propionicimonas sp.]